MKSKEKRKSKTRTVLKALGIAALVGAIGVFSFVGYVILSSENHGRFDPTKLHNMEQSTIILDAQDRRVTSVYGTVNRISVSIERVPTYVRNAFLAAEDLRFYEHFGVDVVRIFGALWHDITTGTLRQGASTIDQQLIKNTYLTPDKEFSRKILEAWLALQLDRAYTKDDILEMYLNSNYYGNGAYGIETASQKYFGKHVEGLTVAEGALLAGVLKSTTRYSPHIQPENSIKRRNLVLQTMLDNQMIDQATFAAASKEPLHLVESPSKVPCAWYVDTATDEAETLLGISGEELLSGGYRIYTELDTELQQQCEAFLLDDALFPKVAQDGTPVQGAVAVVEKGGAVRVLVGGRTPVRKGFNRATAMRRQPGSTLKPLAVYAPAIDRFGMTAATIFNDAPTTFDDYAPRNFNDSYYGYVTMRTALQKSLNIPAVTIMNQIGSDAVRDSLTRAGIPLDALDTRLPLALGSMTYGVAPLDMATGYLPFIQHGKAVQPRLIRRIERWDGVVLYEADTKETVFCSAPAAYVCLDMLRSAATEGTAKRLQESGLPVAGKTGTVNIQNYGNKDAWIVGLTPDVSVCVWMGFDMPDASHAMENSVGGSSLPTVLAAKILKSAYPNGTKSMFEKPEGVVEARIDVQALYNQQLLLLAGPQEPDELTMKEVFVEGTQPTKSAGKWEAPQPPYDFQVQPGSNGYPLLSATLLRSDVQYRLYRQDAQGNAAWIYSWNGSAGSHVEYTDWDAQRGETYQYYVVPANPEAEAYGVPGTGRSTAYLQYSMPWVFFNWQMPWQSGQTQGQTQEARPTPGADTPETTPGETMPPAGEDATMVLPP